MIIQHAWLYDNFRQFLFASVPLLLAATTSLSKVMGLLRWRVARIVLAAGILAPGVISIANLHPYQYVYYNSLVGGVTGAARRFELDYWCTSFREAADWLNQTLPPEATLAVWGSRAALGSYVRPDIALRGFVRDEDLVGTGASLAAICIRANIDQSLLVGHEYVHAVTILGAPLSVVKLTGTAGSP